MTKQRKSILQRGAAWLCWLGGGLLLLTAIAFAATAVYEWIVPPTDLHLPGLLTAAMMFYAAPIGVILLALGGLMRIGTSFAHRKTTNDIS
jgi:hypothetical protein